MDVQDRKALFAAISAVTDRLNAIETSIRATFSDSKANAVVNSISAINTTADALLQHISSNTPEKHGRWPEKMALLNSEWVMPRSG